MTGSGSGHTGLRKSIAHGQAAAKREPSTCSREDRISPPLPHTVSGRRARRSLSGGIALPRGSPVGQRDDPCQRHHGFGPQCGGPARGSPGRSTRPFPQASRCLPAARSRWPDRVQADGHLHHHTSPKSSQEPREAVRRSARGSGDSAWCGLDESSDFRPGGRVLRRPCRRHLGLPSCGGEYDWRGSLRH